MPIAARIIATAANIPSSTAYRRGRDIAFETI
jgi:hypothetical protein